MTRDEHLKWCKERAYQEINFSGRGNDGIISMMSDLSKHPETANHSGIKLATMFMMMGKFDSADEARKFIEGFN